MGKEVIIPWGWKMCPSKYFNSVANVLSLGEPMAFQQKIYMMQVKDRGYFINQCSEDGFTHRSHFDLEGYLIGDPMRNLRILKVHQNRLQGINLTYRR